MPRVKRGTKRHDRRKKLLKLAKGYYLNKSKLYKFAKESVDKALVYAYRDRKCSQARFPPAVDHPHRRRCPAEWTELQSVHSRIEDTPESTWIARFSQILRCRIPPLSRSLAETAQKGRCRLRSPLDYGTMGFTKCLRVMGSVSFDSIEAPVRSANCASLSDLRSLEDIRNRYLSRKSGLLTITAPESAQYFPPTERAEFGQAANELKGKIESALEQLQARAFRPRRRTRRSNASDWTSRCPGNRRRMGHRHPLTIVRKEIEDIFVAMGYTVEDGPEVESTYYNFDALNIPASHPARDPQGYVLHLRRCRASDAHVAGADSHDGKDEATGSDHLSRAGCFGATRSIRRTRRCFIRSKVCSWMKASRSRT